jgi:hypothetical protein
MILQPTAAVVLLIAVILVVRSAPRLSVGQLIAAVVGIAVVSAGCATWVLHGRDHVQRAEAQMDAAQASVAEEFFISRAGRHGTIEEIAFTPSKNVELRIDPHPGRRSYSITAKSGPWTCRVDADQTGPRATKCRKQR